MGRKKDGEFWESAKYNTLGYIQYYNRLVELSVSMFEWKNLPETIDARYMELVLFSDGQVVFFEDEELGFLALRCMIGAPLNVYQIPTKRTAYASNGYQNNLDMDNSVLIYNNLIHTNSKLDVEQFSRRLYNYDRIIDVNANAQKTPILISCDETQRLTLKNLYMQYDGNVPFIFGDKNLNPQALRVITTDAPYVADKIMQLKIATWNEALTYLGINNVNNQKKERLITDEVIRNQGGTVASRYSRLEARRQACEQINRMFGLDIWCDYREDYQLVIGEDAVEGEPNSDGQVPTGENNEGGDS